MRRMLRTFIELTLYDFRGMPSSPEQGEGLLDVRLTAVLLCRKLVVVACAGRSGSAGVTSVFA